MWSTKAKEWLGVLNKGPGPSEGCCIMGLQLLVNYFFRNGLGLQVIVFRLQCCLSKLRTSKIYCDQLTELIATFIL